MPVYGATDANVALKYFNHKLKNLFDKHAPISEKRVKSRPCKWLTTELKIEMDHWGKLHRKAQKSCKLADIIRNIKNEETFIIIKFGKPKPIITGNLLIKIYLTRENFGKRLKSFFQLKRKKFVAAQGIKKILSTNLVCFSVQLQKILGLNRFLSWIAHCDIQIRLCLTVPI